MKLSNSAAQVSTRLKTARDAELLAALAHRRAARRSSASRNLRSSEMPSRLALRNSRVGQRVERASVAGLLEVHHLLHLLAGTTDRSCVISWTCSTV